MGGGGGVVSVFLKIGFMLHCCLSFLAHFLFGSDLCRVPTKAEKRKRGFPHWVVFRQPVLFVPPQASQENRSSQKWIMIFLTPQLLQWKQLDRLPLSLYISESWDFRTTASVLRDTVEALPQVQRVKLEWRKYHLCVFAKHMVWAKQLSDGNGKILHVEPYVSVTF